MEIQDPLALGRLAVKVGLITEAQLAEAFDEFGGKPPDLITMLRALERRAG